MATIYVNAGGNLQAAINAAVAGDVLVLDDGATFTGNFTLPIFVGSSAITIQGVTVPTAGVRVSPAGAVNFPKLQAPVGGSPALATDAGCHDWTIIGLEILPNPGGFGDLVSLGDGSSAQATLADVPQNLVLDRCYLHGDATTGQKRGVSLQSGTTTISNGYFADFKLVGQDSQAIAGWNGPGPWTITNNYLEAAGENFLVGGDTIRIPNLIPTGITFTNNTVTKPLAWRGAGFTVKNLLELKTGADVLIDSNAFSYNWGGEGQAGYALVITVRNEDGSNPWATIQNVRVTRNTLAHAGGAFNVLGKDDRGASYPSVTLTGLLIEDNVLYDIDGDVWTGGGQFSLVHSGDAIAFNHNTYLRTGGAVTWYLVDAPCSNFVATNNLVVGTSLCVDETTLGLLGTAALDLMAAPWTFSSNAIIGGTATGYPAGNFYPADIAAVGFVNAAADDYRLLPSSPYVNAASDGTDIGARFGTAPTPDPVPDPRPIPSAPGTPANPSPADTATGIALVTTLAWSQSADTVSYAVAFGTVNPPPSVVASQPGTTYTPTLAASTLYYWSIIASGLGGATDGPVWSFTTGATPTPPPDPPPDPPGAPSDPTPIDTATAVCAFTNLSWAANEASTYAIALGTTSPPPLVSSGLTSATYDPGGLAWLTTYYWRVTASNAAGSTVGDIWSFTTRAAPTGIIVGGSVVGTLLPWVKPQFFDAYGDPVGAGALYFYVAGTSTLLATFSDVDLTIPNTNPIVLNSAGQSATSIYLQETGYKVILQDADGVQLWAVDDVEAINATP